MSSENISFFYNNHCAPYFDFHLPKNILVTQVEGFMTSLSYLETPEQVNVRLENLLNEALKVDGQSDYIKDFIERLFSSEYLSWYWSESSQVVKEKLIRIISSYGSHFKDKYRNLYFFLQNELCPSFVDLSFTPIEFLRGNVFPSPADSLESRTINLSSSSNLAEKKITQASKEVFRKSEIESDLAEIIYSDFKPSYWESSSLSIQTEALDLLKKCKAHRMEKPLLFDALKNLNITFQKYPYPDYERLIVKRLADKAQVSAKAFSAELNDFVTVLCRENCITKKSCVQKTLLFKVIDELENLENTESDADLVIRAQEIFQMGFFFDIPDERIVNVLKGLFFCDPNKPISERIRHLIDSEKEFELPESVLMGMRFSLFEMRIESFISDLYVDQECYRNNEKGNVEAKFVSFLDEMSKYPSDKSMNWIIQKTIDSDRFLVYLNDNPPDIKYKLLEIFGACGADQIENKCFFSLCKSLRVAFRSHIYQAYENLIVELLAKSAKISQTVFSWDFGRAMDFLISSNADSDEEVCLIEFHLVFKVIELLENDPRVVNLEIQRKIVHACFFSKGLDKSTCNLLLDRSLSIPERIVSVFLSVSKKARTSDALSSLLCYLLEQSSSIHSKWLRSEFSIAQTKHLKAIFDNCKEDKDSFAINLVNAMSYLQAAFPQNQALKCRIIEYIASIVDVCDNSLPKEKFLGLYAALEPLLKVNLRPEHKAVNIAEGSLVIPSYKEAVEHAQAFIDASMQENPSKFALSWLMTSYEFLKDVSLHNKDLLLKLDMEGRENKKFDDDDRERDFLFFVVKASAFQGVLSAYQTILEASPNRKSLGDPILNEADDVMRRIAALGINTYGGGRRFVKNEEGEWLIDEIPRTRKNINLVNGYTDAEFVNATSLVCDESKDLKQRLIKFAAINSVRLPKEDKNLGAKSEESWCISSILNHFCQQLSISEREESLFFTFFDTLVDSKRLNAYQKSQIEEIKRERQWA